MSKAPWADQPTPSTDGHEYVFINHDECAGETLKRICDGKDVAWDEGYSGSSVSANLCRAWEQRARHAEALLDQVLADATIAYSQTTLREIEEHLAAARQEDRK